MSRKLADDHAVIFGIIYENERPPDRGVLADAAGPGGGTPLGR